MLTYRKYLMFVPVIAFAALLIAGLVVSVMSLQSVSSEEWAKIREPAKILSGESTRRFTKLLNQHFVLGKTFNQIESGIQWNLTGDLGPGARAGCGDWLFLADELETYPDRAKSAGFRASVVQLVNQNLKKRGIKLLVVVVPDKTRIEHAHLCGLNRSRLFAGRIVSWLDAVKSVATLDLTSTLESVQGDRYYHTDTHWNEAGANAAAEAVANRLSELKWLSIKPGSIVVLNQVRSARPGDLVHLAGLDGLPGLLRPKVEMAEVSRIAPVRVASDDLFGDAGLPTIALMGTSYSRNSNFVPFLEHHLGEPVANVARDGGDFSGAATAFFASNTFRTDPPRIIVWEIPERVIESPVKETEKKWLKALADGHL